MNIHDRINDTRYECGVIEFLDFAYRDKDESLAIPCPCRSCNNFRDKNRETIYKHLMQNGISRGYTTWNYHGEESDDDDGDGGGDDVPFDGSDGGTDDMSDDDLDEMLNNIGGGSKKRTQNEDLEDHLEVNSPRTDIISTRNKMNRSKNLVPPVVGSKSMARVVHDKMKQGKQVTAIGQYEIRHYSRKKDEMINETADKILRELRDDEANSSSTPAEICMAKLGPNLNLLRLLSGLKGQKSAWPHCLVNFFRSCDQQNRKGNEEYAGSDDDDDDDDSDGQGNEEYDGFDDDDNGDDTQGNEEYNGSNDNEYGDDGLDDDGEEHEDAIRPPATKFFM
nr:myb domain protein 62 [Tanacetum cinerariifolium]